MPTPPLGEIGIWQGRTADPGTASEIESLGFQALWIGFSPSIEDVRPFLERSSALPIATGILNIWQHEAAEVAAGHAELQREFGGRFLLGLGIAHPESTTGWEKPVTRMREYLDGLDAAESPVPRDERALAALGPKMLELAAERSLGAHPYFTPVEHTRSARERLGPGPLIATEVAVVLDSDPKRGREKARDYAARYLGRRNYANNLYRHGFDADDVRDGGSDRLIDAVVPHGSAEEVAETVRAHLDAGADHVCVQPLGNPGGPVEDYRALAKVLL